MARVNWSNRAKYHVRVTGAYFRDQSGYSELGDEWAEKIFAKTDILVDFPEIGSPVEGLGYDGLRELLVYPYRIIYRYDGRTCTIDGVVHGKQDLRNVFPSEDDEHVS